MNKNKFFFKTIYYLGISVPFIFKRDPFGGGCGGNFFPSGEIVTIGDPPPSPLKKHNGYVILVKICAFSVKICY